MGKQTSKNFKVGVMVITGTLLLFAALYMVGSRQNLFSSSFVISAQFNNVNGLMAGNSVRFAGIDIGTVREVRIANDSTVEVTMTIRKEVRNYIRKNAVASIGTDGLMGNKLVNIVNGKGEAPLVEPGDRIATAASSEIESLIAGLSGTSEDISEVVRHIKEIIADSAFKKLPRAVDEMAIAAENVKRITQKVNQSDALWKTLNDRQLSENLRLTVENVRKISEEAAHLTTGLQNLISDIESGKGTAGMLISDTVLSRSIQESAENIRMLSASLITLSEQMNHITLQVAQGQGVAGMLISDSTAASQLKQTILHVQNSSRSLEQNMEALKSNFLFRRYFKKQAK